MTSVKDCTHLVTKKVNCFELCGRLGLNVARMYCRIVYTLSKVQVQSFFQGISRSSSLTVYFYITLAKNFVMENNLTNKRCKTS